ARSPRAQPHLEVDRVVCALCVPAGVPPLACRQTTRRDGSARGGSARGLRLRRPAARAAAAAERRPPTQGGGGGLVGAPGYARPGCGPAALPPLRGGDERGPESAMVGLRLPREPPDAPAADRDDPLLAALRGGPVAVEARVETTAGEQL